MSARLSQAHIRGDMNTYNFRSHYDICAYSRHYPHHIHLHLKVEQNECENVI